MSTLGKHWNLSEKTKKKLGRIAKQKGYGNWMKGRKFSKTTRKRMTEAKKKEYREGVRKPIRMVGKENPKWKGNKVGYRSLHRWIERQLGKPRFCQKCKNRKLPLRQYHWANISGKYKRDLNDWIRVCNKCHKKYY